MTETSFANTHSTAHLFPVTAPTLSPPLVNGSHSGQQDDEEPYTIKCICIFDDDDGSTVFCERCETWQHIVCYYDDQEVPEIHNCTDCEPRVLDSKRATERQKRLREQNDSGDRKGKRSGAKYQKKKTKDAASATDTTNGWNPHDKSGSNSVSKDQQPPTKKQRTSHRSSASVSSVAAALTSDSRKRGASSIVLPSPTKPPSHPPIPLYSQEFLHLYDNDHVNTNMHGNLFDTLGLAGDLASWVQDPSALALVANGRSAKDVFTYSDQPLDHSKWPVLSKQSVTDTSIDYDGRHPTWRFLKVDKDVRKDEIVGEVRGKVGHFRDYCLDPNSRWQELRHPEPFVFFHPQLPIYIDSRKEGTLLRYIRRSCRPNVTLKTFITNEIEYHFCFVANQDISGDSEITTTWYLDPQLFPASNGFVKQEGPNDGIPDAAAISISNVLAHFGGCACDPSQPCLLANVDRRQRPRNSDSNVKQLNGRRKKSKNRNNVSPVSTGRATNSRAGSESRKHRDDEDQSENRSVSGSVRDHPQSRDLTPTGHSAADILGTNGTELSAREKRKIAAAERKFEQLEQDQQHAQKKRKRTNVGTSTSKSSGSSKPPRLDTMPTRRSPSTSAKASPGSANSRRESRLTPKTSAASTPRIGSPLARANYVDCSIQTDSDETDPLYVPPKSPPRPCFVPLTKRLLSRYHHDRLKLDESKGLNHAPVKQAISSMPPPPTPKLPLSPQSEKDIEMKDVDTSITLQRLARPASRSSDHAPIESPELPFKPPRLPLPSTAAHNFPVRSPSGDEPGKLRVQPPQAQPSSPVSFSNNPSSGPHPTYLPPPLSTKLQGPPSSLTPGLGITAPSPVKKRMSLGDYMRSRGNLTTPSAEKSHTLILSGGQPPTPSAAPGNSTESGHTPTKPTRTADEPIKRESDTTSDVVMKDASSLPPHADKSSNPALLSRDPRINPST
ncbi:SET domain containing protein [Coccidioides posadasii C735 delta SOWgp]|uniref:SET domain containing protein n=1 Tax=Coccidioides posadasii (strain C735) TaxID=222929 RepID=C5PJ39_COCP7|nr:SET domain containing protein [Coccidioides posadasii C735 delta SOWgp]EER22988.1 SET domain containing protein [Coccidioides posadasii C735 delta SOWgp]|eukprot:XP_003065133.1 SET domain containing protein [Coccidioides posadasii C735 delta SOWgp]